MNPRAGNTGMNCSAFFMVLAVVVVGPPAAAQFDGQPPAPVRIEPPEEPDAIPLYEDVRGSQAETPEVWGRIEDQRVVRNVTQPTLTPFLPGSVKPTGAAVVVVPGGGFRMVSMDNEGWPVAQWLADHGIAAFVLKYRVMETPADEQAFMKEMIPLMEEAIRTRGSALVHDPRAGEDALAALRRVRRDAAQYGIDPSRVGMLGFSAGAIAALDAAFTAEAGEGPAFVGYIYGPMRAITVPPDAPPLFAALASDDRLFGQGGFGIVESWHKAGRPVELHYYESGWHGFGLGRAGTTSVLLMDQFRAWLQGRGLLKRD